MHHTLCDLMIDIVQNALEAGASEVSLSFGEDHKTTQFEVTDNGRGMDRETQSKAVDPFYTDGRKHAHRRVGLGLPFLFQTAQAAGGHAEIDSEPGLGTTIRFRAPAAHVDLPPTGDFAGAATLLMSMSGGSELRISRSWNGRSYTLDRSELDEALGGLESAGNQVLMRTYIRSQEDDLRKAGGEWEN